MATLSQVIVFTALGGLVSLVGGVILLSRRRTSHALAHYATPFAAGALIAAVFMDLLKEGVEEADPGALMLWTMMGVLAFYFLERFMQWFHHHHHDDEHEAEVAHRKASLPLVITGGIIHNALDGVAIAAAFLVNVPTGIVTTVAVAAHEIPHEIGDFGLLLHKGLSRGRTLAVNLVGALGTVVLAAVTFIVGSEEQLPLAVLIGLSAGFLLYIALSDLIPELHEHARGKRFFDWQPLLLVLGVVVVTGAIQLAHHFAKH